MMISRVESQIYALEMEEELVIAVRETLVQRRIQNPHRGGGARGGDADLTEESKREEKR